MFTHLLMPESKKYVLSLRVCTPRLGKGRPFVFHAHPSTDAIHLSIYLSIYLSMFYSNGFWKALDILLLLQSCFKIRDDRH